MRSICVMSTLPLWFTEKVLICFALWFHWCPHFCLYFQENNCQLSRWWFQWHSLHIALDPSHNKAIAPLNFWLAGNKPILIACSIVYLNMLQVNIIIVVFMVCGPLDPDVFLLWLFMNFQCRFMMCASSVVLMAPVFCFSFGLIQYCLFVVSIYLCSVVGRILRTRRKSLDWTCVRVDLWECNEVTVSG